MYGVLDTIPSNPVQPGLLEELESLVTLEDLEKAVGGEVELIPDFDSYMTLNSSKSCVAFCNKRARSHGLPQNDQATMLWGLARKAKGLEGDYSVFGDVVVVMGNNEFIQALGEAGYGKAPTTASATLSRAEDLAYLRACKTDMARVDGASTQKPALWAVDRRRYINKQGNWAFRPPCSRNDDSVDDASARVHFTCGIAFGLLGNKAVGVGSMIARLHDHKGTLYVVQRRDASPFNETVKAAFQEAWADDAPEFVDIDSPDWQRVWSCRCFN